MVGPTADMDDNSEQVVGIVHMRAVIGGVAQFQLEGEHHPVHQLAHPAITHRAPVSAGRPQKGVARRRELGTPRQRPFLNTCPYTSGDHADTPYSLGNHITALIVWSATQLPLQTGREQVSSMSPQINHTCRRRGN